MGKFVVVDMRYFNGPESPASEQGYLLDVSRWYIKLYDPDDMRYQGRFIVEERQFGRGLVRGGALRHPRVRLAGLEWLPVHRASTASGAPTRACPARGPGLRYDFVEGGEGLTFPGLPSQVEGCSGWHLWTDYRMGIVSTSSWAEPG